MNAEPINLDDLALAIVVDAAKQHRNSVTEAGRLSGIVDLLSNAIRIVERGSVAELEEAA